MLWFNAECSFRKMKDHGEGRNRSFDILINIERRKMSNSDAELGAIFNHKIIIINSFENKLGFVLKLNFN
ncbi:hypothetical protein BLOT_005096 [Blomia tropicalis]|nr:hypothetical protein BLOT_005096 [Blomia tropicalis]